MKKMMMLILMLVMVVTMTGCVDDASVATHNLKKEADMFRVDRRVVFFNGITDTYLLSVEGRCSITDQSNQLEVICKTGSDSYKIHYLGLSDNVSYFVEQLEASNVSVYRYKVIFKPTVIIPDVDLG